MLQFAVKRVTMTIGAIKWNHVLWEKKRVALEEYWHEKLQVEVNITKPPYITRYYPIEDNFQLKVDSEIFERLPGFEPILKRWGYMRMNFALILPNVSGQ
jgi:hypothetical protein